MSPNISEELSIVRLLEMCAIVSYVLCIYGITKKEDLWSAFARAMSPKCNQPVASSSISQSRDVVVRTRLAISASN